MTPHEQAAYDLGVQHAKNAASWVIDGNTPREFIVSLLAMIDDGDPEVGDYVAPPNLSGEWAGATTPTDLYGEIIGYNEHGGIDDPDGETTAALCDAYEQGVSDTFMPECERILREAIAPEDTSEDPCTDHGFDVCPDCGNAGARIGADGYEPCTRFLTCWSDPS